LLGYFSVAEKTWLMIDKHSVWIASDGLQQVSWLWKNKRIRWEDIVEINTGGKSRTVTITGSDGTKIVHSRVLPDRPRLLIELRHHCGENLPSDFPENQ
jgi:Bacterial PH domain